MSEVCGAGNDKLNDLQCKAETLLRQLDRIISDILPVHFLARFHIYFTRCDDFTAIPQHISYSDSNSRFYIVVAAREKGKAMPDDVTHKIACTEEQKSTCLLDLPEELISSILRRLSTRGKCQAQVVCRTFREVLSNPTPGNFVWGVIDLRDSVFVKVPLDVLNR